MAAVLTFDRSDNSKPRPSLAIKNKTTTWRQVDPFQHAPFDHRFSPPLLLVPDHPDPPRSQRRGIFLFFAMCVLLLLFDNATGLI